MTSSAMRPRAAAPRRRSWHDRQTLLLCATGVAIELMLLLGLVRPLWLGSHHAAIPTYEPLATVFGATWSGALRFAITLLLWLAGYFAALALARGPISRTERQLAVGFPILFAGTLLFVLPVSSQDVYHYLMEGRILAVHHANPMVTPPSAFPNDPLRWTVAAWHDDPAPYGPMFVLPAAAIAWLTGDSLIAGVLGFKLLMTLCLFGTAALAAATMQRTRPERALTAYVFIAWNPLALYEASVNAHNTWLMTFFLALALWLTTTSRPALALPALALGALTKYVAGVAGPGIVVGLRMRALTPQPPLLMLGEGEYDAANAPAPQPAPSIAGGRPEGREGVPRPQPTAASLPIIVALSGSLLLSVALYAPFWAGVRTFTGAGTAADFILSSPGWLLRQGLKHRIGWERAGDVTVGVCVAVFLAGWLALLLRQWREGRSGAAHHEGHAVWQARWMFAVLLWQLLTLSWALWPWYPLVLLPAAALVAGWQRRLTLAISAASLLAYVPINFAPAFWGPQPTDRMPLAVVAVMVGLPAAVMALNRSTRALRRP